MILSVSLTVKDVRASVAWYRDVLGFAVNEEYEREGMLRAVSMSADGARILLSHDNGAKGSERAKGEGMSFMLTTTANIDEMATRIKAGGITLDNEPFDGMGARAFRLRDPDGFRFTISSERHS